MKSLKLTLTLSILITILSSSLLFSSNTGCKTDIFDQNQAFIDNIESLTVDENIDELVKLSNELKKLTENNQRTPANTDVSDIFTHKTNNNAIKGTM